MALWLFKVEPDCYSFADLTRDKTTDWDGVANAVAQKHLRAAAKGDRVLYYHSNVGQEVVGVCEVTKEAFPDPTTDDARWVAIELSAVRALKKPVTLETIKADPALRDIALVKQSRLSVLPLDAKAFARIEKLGG